MRVTQRAPQSCIPCTKRKVRCDKKIPCGQCVSRQKESLCKREVVFSRGKLQNLAPDGPSIEEINAGLVKELTRLKAENQLLKQMISENTKNAAKSDVDDRSITVISETLAGLSLGIAPIEAKKNLEPTSSIFASAMKSNDEGSSSTTSTSTSIKTNFLTEAGYEYVDLTEPGALAPPISYDVSKYILEFNLKQISWIHCAVHRKNFLQEHELYWKMLRDSNQLVNEVFVDGNPLLLESKLRRYDWESLWYAMLSSGLYYMEREFLEKIGVSEAAAIEYSEKFLKASLWSLQKAKFMEICNILTVQTFCVLGLVFPAFGGFDIKSSFLSVAIFNCQRLHLNKLAAEDIDTSTYTLKFKNISEKEDFVHRELARRMWWTVVIIDWLTVNIQFPYIDPDSFDTALPLNVRDDDLYSDSLTIPVLPENMDTDISYHICLSKISILRRSCCIKPTYPYTGERDLLSFIEKIRTLFNNLAPALKSDYVDENESQYSVRKFQRNLLASDLQCQLLKAYRELAFGSPPAKCATKARKECQIAAKKIAYDFNQDHPIMYYKNYVPSINAVQAGIFLVMDVLELDENDPERIADLEALGGMIQVMQKIQYGQKTAARGIKLLTQLVKFALGNKSHSLPFVNASNSEATPTEKKDALTQIRELAFSSYAPRMSSIAKHTSTQFGDTATTSNDTGPLELEIATQDGLYDGMTDRMLEELFTFGDPSLSNSM